MSRVCNKIARASKYVVGLRLDYPSSILGGAKAVIRRAVLRTWFHPS
jgi:hypothetical protein